MPKGYCPLYFYTNPSLEKEKSIEEIYHEIQQWTCEFFIDDPLDMRKRTDFFVLLPPLNYNGTFLKGIFFSQGVDYIYNIFPRTSELFTSMAYSMWASVPYSEKADCYMTCYNNPKREQWFKSTYPDKKDKIFIPLEDSDFTSDIVIYPMQVKKDIDIISVSAISPRKNLPMLLKTVMTYHKKYGKLLKTVLITGNLKSKYSEEQKNIIKELENIAGSSEDLKKYIEIIDFVNYGEDLSKYYSRAKVAVLTSLYEGKNRFIHEANLCNVPVIVFNDFNKYIRGKDNAFPKKAGIYAPSFTPDSMADTIHYALRNLNQFTPLASYMKENGRMNFLNKCIDSIPYYRENLPGYIPDDIENNQWLFDAVFDNYQLSPLQFIYGTERGIQQTKLHEERTDAMDFYNRKFNIIGGEKILPPQQ